MKRSFLFLEGRKYSHEDVDRMSLEEIEVFSAQLVDCIHVAGAKVKSAQAQYNETGLSSLSAKEFGQIKFFIAHVQAMQAKVSQRRKTLRRIEYSGNELARLFMDEARSTLSPELFEGLMAKARMALS